MLDENHHPDYPESFRLPREERARLAILPTGMPARAGSGGHRLPGLPNRRCGRLEFHHHAGTAAVRTIIDRAMYIVGEVPRIHAPYGQQATF